MRYVLLAVVALGFASRLTAGPDFARDVLPILSENCFQCHGPDAKARKADLRLDTKADALRKESPVLVPGKSAESEVIKRLLSDDTNEVMPPPKTKKKLTAQQIATLKQWIDEGANWGTHWAFEKPVRAAVPKMSPEYSVLNPIDAFVFARLQKEGLKPSSPTDKTTLIRRVMLDLTGLPPTPAEVDAFLKDTSPNAYEKVVDRLLASPRYGERMVWDWLDAARYADSNGYQGDDDRTMWPWRDWAVSAFNRDLPFDQFTIWQLAGDQLPKATEEQKLATAFLRNHMINGEGGRIPEENRVEYVMDMTETTGTVWLGLTFNCCRCHDHKFDPILQKDYYSLFAFFNQTPVTGAGGSSRTAPIIEVLTPAQEQNLRDSRAAVASGSQTLGELETILFPREKGKPITDSPKAKELAKELKDALTKAPADRSREQLEKLQKHFAAKEQTYGELLGKLAGAVATRDEVARRIPRVMVMEDQAKSRDTFIYQKGLYNKPGSKVTAAFPSMGGSPGTAVPGLRRLDLAKWLVSVDNPLTARVIVNRYWQQFFGYGLVKTVEDFGVQGERPGNQELLDWLAVEFREKGWSLKHLVRLLVTSATYRQSSKVSPVLAERDPENRLLARGPRFRLPSWMIRDQALAASGLLVGELGGPPVNGYQPPGVWEETTFGLRRYKQDHGDALYRRSVYTFWRRIIAPTLFFDSATRQTCTVKQTRTNTPLHALTTLNDVTYVEAARALAQRVMKAEATDTKRIELAMRFVLARVPTTDEAKVLLAGLERMRKQYKADPKAADRLLSVGESKRDEKLDDAEHAALTAVCLTILNLDEALTKE